jgi:hypothetical protein
MADRYTEKNRNLCTELQKEIRRVKKNIVFKWMYLIIILWRFLKISNYVKKEMLTWIGFAVSQAIVFLIIYLTPSLTFDQIGAMWTIAVSVGFINHGILDRVKIMILSGTLSIIVTLIILLLAPMYFSIGWIVLGIGISFSGFSNRLLIEGLVGAYITFGGTLQLTTICLGLVAITDFSIWVIWLIIIGLILTTVGLGTSHKSPIMYILGSSWILVTIVSYVFYPELIFGFVGLVFIFGMGANLIYLYRLLGRTPKLGDIFAFASRALFLRYLKKPLDQYRVIAILIEGNIGAENVIQDLLNHLEAKNAPILLLGPTSPTQLSLSERVSIRWITMISGVSEKQYNVLSPEDPSMINVFLNKTLEDLPKDSNLVILGDFLDNIIPYMDDKLFYKYYSELASSARIKNYTIVFVVKTDIHSEVNINVVKRFAEVIIENREREWKGRFLREVRVSNKVDNLHTDWEKY